jgi:hypothetical protein
VPDEGNKDDTFRVIDRRLFNAEGELRQDVVEEIAAEEKSAQSREQKAAAAPASTKSGPTVIAGGKSAAAAPAAPPAFAPAAAPAAVAPEEPALPEPAVEHQFFRHLVDFLLQNAAFFLGSPDPRTGQSMLDIEGARYMIDLFDALREKTRGNLTAEEDRMLADVIAKLKLAYMDVTKAAASAMREQAATRKP